MKIRVGRPPAPRPPTDAEIAAERIARPLVRRDDLDGVPRLVVDLEGRADVTRDELDRIFSAFVDAAQAAQRERIAADMSQGIAPARLAVQWAIAPRTLRRWREEYRGRVLEVRPSPPETGRSDVPAAGDDGTRPGRSGQRGRAA